MTTHSTLPQSFVYIKNIVPTIMEDIGYSKSDNFTGRPVKGYNAGVSIITENAAQALYKIQETLLKIDMSLEIFDAYRPVRAVQDFIAWRSEPDIPEMQEKYYPSISKQSLFDLGYIASQSSHSRGSTVDLTIFDLNSKKHLDMGTCIDFFGDESNTESKLVSIEARRNRFFLKNIMERHGFKNLHLEWWHYSFSEELFPETYFDFVVE